MIIYRLDGEIMKYLKPFVKWPGGKTSEIKYLDEYFPDKINNYYEPFVGGGALFFYLSKFDVKERYINDKSNDLINLYRLISKSDKIFFKHLDILNKEWNKINLITDKYEKIIVELFKSYKKNHSDKSTDINIVNDFIYKHLDGLKSFGKTINQSVSEVFDKILLDTIISKFERILILEKKTGKVLIDDYIKNIETSLKASFYKFIRFLYNNKSQFNIEDGVHSANFYFIREFCYSSMFRFNKNGEFNVPYGGSNYNRKEFDKKVEYLKSKALNSYLSKTNIYNLDFHDFINEVSPKSGDFMFLDPPYDTEFSEYDQNSFSKNDQTRLRDVLLESKANIMLVIKNTDFINSIYNHRKFIKIPFDKNYTVSFMNRNNKKVQHLIIKNY